MRSVDNKGWTAFHYAAFHNNELGFDELIFAFESELELNEAFNPESPHATMKEIMAMTSCTPEQETAHHIAAFEGSIYVLTELMKYCPDACLKADGNGRNILHIAAMQNHKELIQSFLQDFPNVVYDLITTPDKNGNTPIHQLVISGCFVPQLIETKLYVNRRNKDRFNPEDLLYLDENIIGDQLMIKKAFEELAVNIRRFLWFRKMEESASSRINVVQPSVRRKKDAKFKMEQRRIMKEEVELYRGRTNTQIIVTALIATVTFTVRFTMPGGNHDGDTGDAANGLAILSKKTAFNICILADATGLLFSASALFHYFMSSIYQDPYEVSRFNAASTAFNIVSVVAMMLTFITGSYAVLSHSLAIAITVSVILCLFFFVVIVLLIKWKSDPIEKFKV